QDERTEARQRGRRGPAGPRDVGTHDQASPGAPSPPAGAPVAPRGSPAGAGSPGSPDPLRSAAGPAAERWRRIVAAAATAPPMTTTAAATISSTGMPDPLSPSLAACSLPAPVPSSAGAKPSSPAVVAVAPSDPCSAVAGGGATPR